MAKDHSADYLERLKTGGGLQIAQEVQGDADQQPDPLLGRTLGSYELYEHIADGGMSRVYRARRADGSFDRDVAVKVSVAGRLDAQSRERFFQEQQILASLNHPGIAQLYDVGIADEGWPFIVMELVDGIPIDQYCANVEIGERLELLRKICAALSFAHARLVVHRDIKPANVLVTPDGEPKLLDFGIAKLLTTDAAATQTPSLTPGYASPEQLRGDTASVPSDIYQVGLLLAEVLNPGLVVRPASLLEAMQRAVSATGTSIDRGISGTLPRELVSIVEQCVRVNPEERYAAIGDVRADLTSYLQGYPVRASGNTRAYRARKFIQRNFLYLASTAVAVAAFLLSGAWYLLEVNAARDRAELEAATSREVADFLAGLFRASAPSNLRGEDLTAGELLERGLERIDEEIGDRPRVHAQLQSALGDVYRDLGDYETAESLLNQALLVQQRELGEAHPLTLNTLKSLAKTASGKGLLAEAERLYRDLLDLQIQALGAAHPDTLDSRSLLASTLRRRGDFATAASIQGELVELYRATGGIDSAKGIGALTGLAIATIQSGDPQGAIPYFEEAYRLSKEVLGPRHVQTIGAINNMAVTFQETGQPEKSLPYAREGYEQNREVFGPDHHHTVSSAVNLSNTLRQLDRLDEAREYAEFAYDTAMATLPRSHMATDRALTEMGFVEMAAGEYERAEAHFLALLEIEQEHLGKAHMYTIGTQLKAAAAIAAQDRLAEATVLVEEAVELLHETQGPEHQETLLAEKQLAGLRIMQGRFDEAKPMLRRVIDGLSVHLGEEAQQVSEAESMLEDAEERRMIDPA